MNFSVDSASLVEAVVSVTKALPVRTSMPVLEGVLIRANSNGVSILCSDLMMQKECVLSARVTEEGECVVKGKIFTDIIRKLPPDTAFVNISGSALTIRCGKTVNNLQCMEYEEFPVMKFEGSDVENVSLSIEDCRTLINRTAFAVGNDEARPMLAGVFMETEGHSLSMVATDSFQFARNCITVENELPTRAFLIPAKTVTEAARMTDETVETITLVFSDTHMKVDLGTTCMVARLLDSNYIEYKRLIPKDCKTRVLVDRESMIEAVDRCSLVCREGNNSIKMSFANNSISLKAEGLIGKAEDAVDAQIMGADIDIAFNPKYILNVLKSMSAEKLYLEMNSSINPCVFKPQSEEDSLFLVVPMRMI